MFLGGQVDLGLGFIAPREPQIPVALLVLIEGPSVRT